MSSNPNEVERLYMDAMTAARGGRLEEAAEMLDQMMVLDPNYPDAWWNLGTFRAMLNQHAPALSVWDIYRRMVPDDWRARVKVIQSCQALGETARRDRERDELLALRRAGADPALAAEVRFCREQFNVGVRPVVAYEIFEPAGEMRVFYQFLVGQPDGPLMGLFSLGSYDSTTEVSREAGRIGPDERIYHLDWYNRPEHRTYGFFSELPSYEETRAHVVAAMTDALPVLSSAIASPETGKSDIYLPNDAAAIRDISMAHEFGVLATGGYPPLSATGQPAPGPSPAPPAATGGPPEAGAAGTSGSATAEKPGGRLAGWARRLMGRAPRPN